MTAPVNAPPASTAKDAASARKRRRRAPAGGAADDCFTCAKRNVKCDRKRPYCSQCLEIGNDCSGYKTQLTWGVGVASRGKLRGLSLPIAKAPPVAGAKTTKSPIRIRTTPAPSMGQWQAEQDDRASRDVAETIQQDRTTSVPPPSPYHPYELSHLSPHGHGPTGWTHISFQSDDGPRFPGRSLPLPITTHGEMMTTGMDAMSDVDYMSPMAHSFSRDDMPPFLHSPSMMYDSYPNHGSPVPQSPVSAIMIEQPRAPTSCPSLAYTPSDPASSLHSHLSHVDSLEARLSRKMTQDCDMFGWFHPLSGLGLNTNSKHQLLQPLIWIHIAQVPNHMLLSGLRRAQRKRRCLKASRTMPRSRGLRHFPHSRRHQSSRSAQTS